MSVHVWNREQAQKLIPREKEVIISISQPGEPANLRDGWMDILKLEFSDYTSEEIGKNELNSVTLFTEDMAKQIWNFVNKYEKFVFHVHCDAGISRSVAVGLIIADVFGVELKLHAIDTSALANSLVTRLLKRQL